MRQRRARTTLAGLIVLTTASTTVLTGGQVAAAPAGTPAPTLTPAATVTLVTGDVVRLGGPNGVDVTAARGRERIGFRTQTDVDGDVYVIPADAQAGVASGKLDRRLFDVTELARAGYGNRADIPLIVDYPGATPRLSGAKAVRELPSLSAVAVTAGRDGTYWPTVRDSAKKVWLDGPVKASLDHSVPQIGAPEAWAAGYTGAGTTVAVLDTGIDVTHPDLDDAVTAAQDFTGSASGTDDRFGHGTHVASIITGSGDASGGKYKGVAPDAHLMNGKVLDDDGFGQESWIIAGMEWAARNGADVISMSLGSAFPSDGTDPESQAVNRLTAETGALFVIAAGNRGPGRTTVTSPGAADAALTVGAVDRDDQLAEFSSRGPRRGDDAIKPDITAPGVDIVAAKAKNGQIGTPVGDGYVSLSGTSMATPHVSGAAAILAGEHPDWGPERLKATLMGSAKANPGLSAFEQGAGRVDVAAATRTTVSASPVSMNLGTAQWPHQDDQPITRTITYTNAGTAPVTLDLTTDMTGPDGKPAAAGMFTASPAHVTVPAGGTADVTLTTDTRVDGADGAYSGAVVATAGDTNVRTPVVVTREVESYDLKVTVLGLDGKPVPDVGPMLVDPVHPVAYYPVMDPSGTATVRLPKGRYYFDGATVDAASGVLTDLKEPGLVVDGGHTEYTFDTRGGVKPGFVVDKPDATLGGAAASFRMTTRYGAVGSSQLLTDFEHYRVLPSRTSAPGDFRFTLEGKLAKPDGTGGYPGFHASPYLYNLRYTDDGVVPADVTREAPDRRLAKVVSSYAVATPGRLGIRDGIVSMPLPYTLTEYYTPDTEWTPYFNEKTDPASLTPNGFSQNVFTPRSYKLGPVVHERWNAGVFGPGLAYSPDPLERGSWFARAGDDFRVAINMHGDRNADVDGGNSNEEGQLVGTSQLLSGGQVIAEYDGPGIIFADLKPETATYTMRTTATTSGPLSTRIDAEWTFQSGRTTDVTPVPALTVRFAPDLDDHNATPAGRRFCFPVYVQRNGTTEVGQVNAPAVDVSYDDGRTWQKVRLTQQRGQWLAEVDHPKGAKFASLRWSVTDNAGNAAKATIIHAYALK